MTLTPNDPPTPPSVANVNVEVASRASVWTATRVVALLFTVLEVLLLFRFIFKLFGANTNQAFVALLYGLTEPLVRPFQGIFPEPSGPTVFDVAALLAILFLFLIAALIVALVKALTTDRTA